MDFPHGGSVEQMLEDAGAVLYDVFRPAPAQCSVDWPEQLPKILLQFG
jgi:hypothetical protein